MADNVKISALELENVKRIKAIQLVPTENGLTVIGGRNAQGKSSVLDAIAWALGGNKMKPKAPNRDGAETPASIHMELNNGLIVERSGKNGTLKVTDSRGLKGGQALLDEFVGQLALDLPRFMIASDKERADYLLGILGVSDELARIDGEIKSAYDERRFVGQDADRKAKAAEDMEFYADAPAETISLTDLTAKMQEAMAQNAANADARGKVERMRDELDRRKVEIDGLTAKLNELTAKQSKHIAIYNAEAQRVSTLVDIDYAPIESAIKSAEDTNAKVRANQRKADAQRDAEHLAESRDALTKKLDALRKERVALLDNAGMPLAGISVDGGVLSYNGHVWSDMSGAEQLRVATAIVRATKPECGFVLVDKLEQFDAQQLSEFAAWCESEGLQVIGTRVATDDSCTVIIEDGTIVGQEVEQ
jgi:energy-coupling factor transporter ATP-binding protein EcfA2